MTDLSQLDVRTKATVEDGITLHDTAGPAQIIDYQPGNGTRYRLSIVDTSELSDDTNVWLGFGRKNTGWIITYLNNRGYAMVIGRNDKFLSAHYVQEKLRCGLSDAFVLAELLGKLLGRGYQQAGP